MFTKLIKPEIILSNVTHCIYLNVFKISCCNIFIIYVLNIIIPLIWFGSRRMKASTRLLIYFQLVGFLFLLA